APAAVGAARAVDREPDLHTSRVHGGTGLRVVARGDDVLGFGQDSDPVLAEHRADSVHHTVDPPKVETLLLVPVALLDGLNVPHHGGPRLGHCRLVSHASLPPSRTHGPVHTSRTRRDRSPTPVAHQLATKVRE